MRIEVQNGERVIVDPAVTNTRIFLYFYFAINFGSVAGQISMVYVEKYHSFWLAFFIPTILFLTAPIVLAINKKHYKLSPPHRLRPVQVHAHVCVCSEAVQALQAQLGPRQALQRSRC
ncbi:hypothetical protein FSOLCH5_004873 [Fusarium solani]